MFENEYFKHLIEKTLDELYKEEPELFVLDDSKKIKKHVGERAIVFRFGLYFQKELDEQSALKFGTVIRIIYSTSSKPFGFISCEDGEEVFFTCKNNPTLKIKDLKGEKVSFNVTLKNGKNRRQAYNVKRLEE
jgi:cold shock CspA family protein